LGRRKSKKTLMKEKALAKAKEMLEQGMDRENIIEEVMKETGLNVFQVSGLVGALIKKAKRRESGSSLKNNISYNSNKGAEGFQGIEGSNQGSITLKDEPLKAPSPAVRNPVGYGATEATVEVAGIPVSRKVVLTPKNLALFDWFKAKYGYDGGLSDFINDCIEDFFRSRGYVLVVRKEEEIA